MGACMLMRGGREQIYEIRNYEINLLVYNKHKVDPRDMTLVIRFILELSFLHSYAPNFSRYGMLIVSE